jgi:hypothetical protein
MLEVLLVFAALATFLIFVGVTMPKDKTAKATVLLVPDAPQYRPRSLGKGHAFDAVVKEATRRSMQKNSINTKYLRQLKQADWYWAPGEIVMPNPQAPFWNLETLWGEKIFGALLWGSVIASALLLAGFVMAISGQLSFLLCVLVAAAVGGIVGLFMYTSPDSALEGAARKRQQELALEMGYRIPELRGDVLAGNTIQRAIRTMARRPGGPFVAELRRTVAILDVTKDDILAMDQLIERNEGNELIIVFANNLKMVSRQGGQVAPVLNILADLSQQRLRQQINAQARKNLQEMTRPVGLSSMMVTTILIIVPALVGVMGSLSK